MLKKILYFTTVLLIGFFSILLTSCATAEGLYVGSPGADEAYDPIPKQTKKLDGEWGKKGVYKYKKDDYFIYRKEIPGTDKLNDGKGIEVRYKSKTKDEALKGGEYMYDKLKNINLATVKNISKIDGNPADIKGLTEFAKYSENPEKYKK